MALTPNQHLNTVTSTTLRDQQHAARLYVDDKFRLLPKTKFLYHVSFNINSAALKNIALVQRHRNEINMLVKSVDLPNFNISYETLNQYNRKKNVMTGIKYNTINIKFHDDNMGLINQLWQNYYSYYFADSNVAGNAGAYNRTATRNASFITSPYGLDNGSILPFFNSITIYQLARHEYVSYKLHNPVLASWNHNGMDSSSQASHDNQAAIAYEAVSYSSGSIDENPPEGFGVEHYDQTPSPLQGGTGLTSSSPSFTNSSNVDKNSASFLNNLTATVNGYQNTSNSTVNSGLGKSILSNTAVTGTGGLGGVKFPGTNTTTTTTVATKIKF